MIGDKVKFKYAGKSMVGIVLAEGLSGGRVEVEITDGPEGWGPDAETEESGEIVIVSSSRITIV